MTHFHKEKCPSESVRGLIQKDTLFSKSNRFYSVTTSTTVSVSPSIVKRTSRLPKLKP